MVDIAAEKDELAQKLGKFETSHKAALCLLSGVLDTSTFFFIFVRT